MSQPCSDIHSENTLHKARLLVQHDAPPCSAEIRQGFHHRLHILRPNAKTWYPVLQFYARQTHLAEKTPHRVQKIWDEQPLRQVGPPSSSSILPPPLRKADSPGPLSTSAPTVSSSSRNYEHEPISTQLPFVLTNGLLSKMSYSWSHSQAKLTMIHNHRRRNRSGQLWFERFRSAQLCTHARRPASDRDDVIDRATTLGPS